MTVEGNFAKTISKVSEQGSLIKPTPLLADQVPGVCRLEISHRSPLQCPRNKTQRSHGSGQPPVDRSAEQEVFEIQYRKEGFANA
jgi:hypothetical protein